MNFDVIANSTLAVQIHICAAFAALALGIIMWLQPKGTSSHKRIGRAFLGFMLCAAFSALFIRLINNGKFSYIHLFVPLTVLASIQAVYYVRRGQIKQHKRAVKGMFFGALLIPGALSFLPGRIMWRFIFG